VTVRKRCDFQHGIRSRVAYLRTTERTRPRFTSTAFRPALYVQTRARVRRGRGRGRTGHQERQHGPGWMCTSACARCACPPYTCRRAGRNVHVHNLHNPDVTPRERLDTGQQPPPNPPRGPQGHVERLGLRTLMGLWDPHLQRAHVDPGAFPTGREIPGNPGEECRGSP
jgi:hypothetical protein